jgi:nucleotide-binding universal stress UspA family protein
MRVLVCIDGSEGSSKALHFALRLAKGSGYPLSLLHVVPKLPTTREEARREAEKAGTEAEEGYDLLVLGSRGKGRVDRLLLGSVSSKLVTASSKSVLVVR